LKRTKAGREVDRTRYGLGDRNHMEWIEGNDQKSEEPEEIHTKNVKERGAAKQHGAGNKRTGQKRIWGNGRIGSNALFKKRRKGGSRVHGWPSIGAEYRRGKKKLNL